MKIYFDHSGEFWTVDNPNNKTKGLFTYSFEDGPRLRLFAEELEEEVDIYRRESTEDFVTIFGECSNETMPSNIYAGLSHNAPLTLIGCNRVGHLGTNPIYGIDTVLLNIHSYEDTRYTEMQLVSSYLNEWRWHIWDREPHATKFPEYSHIPHPTISENQKLAELTLEVPEDDIAYNLRGDKIYLAYNVTSGNIRTWGSTISRDCHLHIKWNTPISLNEVLDSITRIHSFLSICVDAPVEIDEISLWAENANKRELNLPITLLRYLPRPEERDKKHFELQHQWARFSVTTGAEGIANWIEADIPTLNMERMTEIFYNRSMKIEEWFRTIASAVEGCLSYSNDHLKKKLEIIWHCLYGQDTPLPSWIPRAYHLRNELIHSNNSSYINREIRDIAWNIYRMLCLYLFAKHKIVEQENIWLLSH